MKNDFREFYDEDYIMHGYESYSRSTHPMHSGGRKWKNHKYLYIDKNGNYIYPKDVTNRIKSKVSSAANAIKGKVSDAFKGDDALTKMQKKYHRSMKKSAVKDFGRNIGNSFKQLGDDWYDESPGLQKFNKKAKNTKKKAGFVTGMIGKDIKRNINKNKKTYADDIVGRLNKVVKGSQKDKQKMLKVQVKIDNAVNKYAKKHPNAANLDLRRIAEKIADQNGYHYTYYDNGVVKLTKHYYNRSGDKIHKRNKYRNQLSLKERRWM